MHRPRRVLHLLGSAQSEFYRDLSFVYANDCLQATSDSTRYENVIACVTPDRRWRFADRLSRSIFDDVPSVSLSEALAQLEQLGVDVALPQMFCIPGMTEYRCLVEMLGIPLVGNPAEVMSLAAHKAKARAIVASAGVPVPEGQVTQRGKLPQIACPAVVKPVDADNSLGVSLVQSADQFPQALDLAWQHSADVLVEQFVPLGRELRCGVIERDGKLEPLPIQEYCLDASHPIRSYESKLTTGNDGNVDLTSKFRPSARIVDADDPVVQPVWQAAVKCHRALGCRDYSLFDFRIDPQGRPYFLEAGLYCSFAPNSILVAMVEATGKPLTTFFAESLAAAISRNHSITPSPSFAT